MPNLKELLLTRMGDADAMAHRATTAAQRLRKAAHAHHDAANRDVVELGKQVEAAGIGGDEEAENRYCRALVTRAHMIQAGQLAAMDAAKLPEAGAHLRKSAGARVTGDLARAIGDRIGVDWANEEFSPMDLARAIEYELERGDDHHGTLETTARVALARLRDALAAAQQRREARKALAAEPAVYLIRHATTGMNSDNPRDEKVRGWTNVPLDAAGRAEAKKIGQAAKAFGLKLILTSDLGRAVDTAKAISDATGAPVVQQSEAFRPWNMGRLQGRRMDDVENDLELYVKRFPEKAVPGGEPFDEFRTRFLGALSAILEARDDGALPNLAIVTHSRNLKLTEAWLKEGGEGDEVDGDTYLERNAPAPGGIVRLTPSKDGWEFERLEEPYLEKAVRQNQARLEAAGQGTMSFEEDAHPRAAQGSQGQYKPGEFVPKGKQQAAVEKPDPATKDPLNEYVSEQYIAFRPEQVKSVDNQGTFDSTDPDIYKAVRRPFVPPDVPRWRGKKPDPGAYLPLNGVEDREKFLAMAREMREGQWRWDVPLIVCGDQLLTGSHRYAAARMAGVPVETKHVDDIFTEAGLNFRECWKRHAQPLVSWISNMDFALQCLPPDVLQHYGIDLG